MAENLPTWARSPRRGGSLFLKSTDEEGAVKVLCVDEKPGYLLGRNKACDVVVKHKTTSRFHACLAFDEQGDCYLVDLGSAHGTFLGGKQLGHEARELLEADNPDRSTFTVGKAPRTFQLTADGGAPRGRHAVHKDANTRHGQRSPSRSSRPVEQPHMRWPGEAEPPAAKPSFRPQNQVYRTTARGVYTPGHYGEHPPPYGEFGPGPRSGRMGHNRGMRGRGPLMLAHGRGPPNAAQLPGGAGFRGRGYIDFRGRPLPARTFPPRGRARGLPPGAPRLEDRYQPEPEPVLYETSDGLVVAEDEFEVEVDTAAAAVEAPPAVEGASGSPVTVSPAAQPETSGRHSGNGGHDLAPVPKSSVGEGLQAELTAVKPPVAVDEPPQKALEADVHGGIRSEGRGVGGGDTLADASARDGQTTTFQLANGDQGPATEGQHTEERQLPPMREGWRDHHADSVAHLQGSEAKGGTRVHEGGKKVSPAVRQVHASAAAGCAGGSSLDQQVPPSANASPAGARRRRPGPRDGLPEKRQGSESRNPSSDSSPALIPRREVNEKVPPSSLGPGIRGLKRARPDDSQSSDSDLPAPLARHAAQRARREGHGTDATQPALLLHRPERGARERPPLQPQPDSSSGSDIDLPQLASRAARTAPPAPIVAARATTRRPLLPRDSETDSSDGYGALPGPPVLPRGGRGITASARDEEQDTSDTMQGRLGESLGMRKGEGGEANGVARLLVEDEAPVVQKSDPAGPQQRNEPSLPGDGDDNKNNTPRAKHEGGKPSSHDDHERRTERGHQRERNNTRDAERRRDKARDWQHRSGDGAHFEARERVHDRPRERQDGGLHMGRERLGQRSRPGPRDMRARDDRHRHERHGPDRGRETEQYQEPGRRERRGHREEDGKNRRHSRSPRKKRRRSRSAGSDQQRVGGKRSRDTPEADLAPAPRPRATGFGAAPPESGGAAPADIVRQMMMGPGGMMPVGGAMSLEQKKKLLWGRKVEPDVPKDPELLFGANRWDAVDFGDDTEKEKFSKLMGLKVVPTALTKEQAVALAHAEPTEREALSKDKAERVLADVEHQFLQGLRRKDGRTVGLGL